MMLFKNTSCTRIVTTKIVLTVIILIITVQYMVNFVVHRTSRGTVFSLVINKLQNTAGSIVTRRGGVDGGVGRIMEGTTAATTAAPDCPLVSPYLKGRVAVDTRIASWGQIEEAGPALLPGGRYQPRGCVARSRVAVVIPYRDRVAHLKIFLQNIHPFLQRQQVDYGIYVVELEAGVKFNRAMLMNIGFVEAAKIYPYQCFVFHDVDLLPEDDRNLYSCPEMPRHMSVAIDSMKYKLLYPQQFGGVSAINKDDFIKINGFSNIYFGWGGEDDDMYKRIVYSNLTVTRYSPEVGRYKMLAHRKDKGNPERYGLLKTTRMRQHSDGVNSLKYSVLRIDYRPLYTRILVTFNETMILKDEQFHVLVKKVVAAKARAKAQAKTQAKAPAKTMKKPPPPAIISWLPANGTAPSNLMTKETLVYEKPKAKLAQANIKLRKDAATLNVLTQLKVVKEKLERLQRQLSS